MAVRRVLRMDRALIGGRAIRRRRFKVAVMLGRMMDIFFGGMGGRNDTHGSPYGKRHNRQ